MTTEEIAAVFARLRDGYKRMDAAALAANYALNCVVESPIAGLYVGRQAVERIFQALFAAFSEWHMNTEELLVFGNRAVWTATLRGVARAEFMGLPSTGKSFSTSIMMLFTFDTNCQIVHERRVYDANRMLLQLAGYADAQGPQIVQLMLQRVQHDHELKIAAEIQRALLPQSQYQGAHCQVAATSIPCRAIGGDFFDYFPLTDGAFSFVLGDVAGKGPSAALLAAMLLGIFASNAHRVGTPALAIRAANETLFRRGIEARFATVVYVTLSCDGRLTYCNAGHNPPLLLGPSGVQRLETGGGVIGLFDDVRFDEQTLQLEPNDLLVAYSDGVTEARNVWGEEFGEERLLARVRDHCDEAAPKLLQCVFDAVDQFSVGSAQADDVTALVMRYAASDERLRCWFGDTSSS